MVSKKSVDKQLKRIHFKAHGWGQAEVRELPHVILPDERIFEIVNGFYEGGFALLLSSDVRVLLIDKKPLNYLTVEDVRFEQINEIDYSHRLFGANIRISTGARTLKFSTLNQARLRKLIGHIQHCMADSKKKEVGHQEDQKQHLQQINQQLQAYLVAQHQHQLQLQKITQTQQAGLPAPPTPRPIKPSPELSDFLFAQSLLAQYQAQTGYTDLPVNSGWQQTATSQADNAALEAPVNPTLTNDLYNAAMQEVFGKNEQPTLANDQASSATGPPAGSWRNPLEINPITIAYSKLPMALRNRKFGRPSFHAHAEASTAPSKLPTQPVEA